MRLMSVLSLMAIALTSFAAAQQVGDKDPLLARVDPVIFCVDPYPEPDPDTPGAALWTLPDDRVAVVPFDSRIPAILGTAFGLEVQAAGQDRLHDVAVTILHPRLGNGTTRHSWVASYPETAKGYSFFGFGTPDELVQGEWEFILSRDDIVLYRHMFKVVAPGDVIPEMRFCQ